MRFRLNPEFRSSPQGMSATPDAMVTISLERLRELEDCEAKISAIKEKEKIRIEALRASQDSKEAAKRALERYHANRDAILARRRELRKAKKEAATAVTPTA